MIENPGQHEKKTLDIGFGDVIAYGIGLLMPPIIFLKLFDLPGWWFLMAWLIMLTASILVLKWNRKSRWLKALAQSAFVGCVGVFAFVFLATAVIRVPLCC